MKGWRTFIGRFDGRRSTTKNRTGGAEYRWLLIGRGAPEQAREALAFRTTRAKAERAFAAMAEAGWTDLEIVPVEKEAR